MKAQKNIWDFYSICKKKLDRLHAKKLNQSKMINGSRTGENAEVSSRSPGHKRKRPAHSVGPAEYQPSRVTRNSPIKLQPKLEIDNETRQIILRSNTIIDQTKSPVKAANYCKDDFVFKKPSSPAPRARRRLDVSLNRRAFSDFKPKRCLEPNRDSTLVDSKRFKSSTDLSDSPVNNENVVNKPKGEIKVRKRLFDAALDCPEPMDHMKDHMKDRVQADPTNEFLTKLKDFQQKTSTSNRFNVSFYSPSKRAQERQDRAAKTKETINYSPKKFLEDKLRNLSPCKSNGLSIENLEPPRHCTPTKNSTPTKYSTPTKQSISLNCTPTKHSSLFASPQKASAAFNLSSFTLTSPFKSPNKKVTDLNLPDKYLELASVFDTLDVVIAQMHNRSVPCTFDRVRLNYRKLAKKDLDLKQLTQIVTIYPNAYLLRSDTKSSDTKSNADDGASLLIKPNIVSSKMIQFTVQIRSNEFKDRLLQFAKRAHEAYLLSLENPIVLNGAHLKRWHPSFQFPDIPEAKLCTPEAAAVLSPKKGSLDELNKSEEEIDFDEIEVIFDTDDDLNKLRI